MSEEMTPEMHRAYKAISNLLEVAELFLTDDMKITLVARSCNDEDKEIILSKDDLGLAAESLKRAKQRELEGKWSA